MELLKIALQKCGFFLMHKSTYSPLLYISLRMIDHSTSHVFSSKIKLSLIKLIGALPNRINKMKNILIILSIILSSFTAKATIHIVNVWDGYFEFTPADITIQLGDTVQWLPLGGGAPSIVHTITSTNIPLGAATFDQIWQAPADTFFQYVPQLLGLYEYECTPHALSHGMIGTINVIGGTAAINNNSSEITNLIIYPNPSPNILNIDGLYSETEYKIYNLIGSLIMSGKTNKAIDISDLIGGNYIIEMLGDKQLIMKFIKQ